MQSDIDGLMAGNITINDLVAETTPESSLVIARNLPGHHSIVDVLHLTSLQVLPVGIFAVVEHLEAVDAVTSMKTITSVALSLIRMSLLMACPVALAAETLEAAINNAPVGSRMSHHMFPHLTWPCSELLAVWTLHVFAKDGKRSHTFVILLAW